MEHLKRVDILSRQQVVEGANVLPNLHKQTPIQATHTAQSEGRTLVNLCVCARACVCVCVCV